MNDSLVIYLFDTTLALGLLWLGWRTVTATDLFKSIVLFIIFGLFTALCWARLAAPDVALAEAALGAGVTGALLMDAYRVLVHSPQPMTALIARRSLGGVILVLTALFGSLLTPWTTLPEVARDLGEQVRTHLPETGMVNPVTAVLLDFRGYDTVLEVAVLLLALLGVFVLYDETAPSPAITHRVADSALMAALVRLLIPLAGLVALYLLWVGAHRPGGAFQAGAVLAGIGILLHLYERLLPAAPAPWWIRGGIAMSLLLFSSIAVGLLLLTGRLLDYPRDWAKLLMLAIEIGLMISTALTLTLLFSNAPSFRIRR